MADNHQNWYTDFCLLYTSDAADDLLCVDLGGRRIIKTAIKLLYTATVIYSTTLIKIAAEIFQPIAPLDSRII